MEKLNYKSQQDSFLILERGIISVILVIYLIALTVGFLLAGKLNILTAMIVIPAVIPALLVYVFLFYLYGARHKYFSYAQDKKGLYINTGVYWRKRIVIPLNRVQHTDVVQGPLDRKYKLATLVVHTAGTRNAVVSLPGILKITAEDLRHSLSFKENTDAV